LPYLEKQREYLWYSGDPNPGPNGELPNVEIKLYQNPLDPSRAVNIPHSPIGQPFSSYACNAQVFYRRGNTMAIFQDGTSSTIAFTEHYARKCGPHNYMFQYPWGNPTPRGDSWTAIGRATFADGGPRVGGGNNSGDYYPITQGTPPVSAAEGGRTFQVRPTLEECAPRLPNAASSRGLQAAMADGSVRTLTLRTSPLVFWALVTPHGGEIIGLD